MIIFSLDSANVSSILSRLNEKCNPNQTLHRIFLGHDHSFIRNELEYARLHGHWILVDDIDLCPKFLNNFDYVLQMISIPNSDTEDNFRAFILASPDIYLPAHILHSSVRYADDGTNMSNYRNQPCLSDEVIQLLEANLTNTDSMQKMIYFCSLNGLIHERRQFKHFGWNLPYEFTDSDLMCALSIVELMYRRPKHVTHWNDIWCIVHNSWGTQMIDSIDYQRLMVLSEQFYDSFSSFHLTADTVNYWTQLISSHNFEQMSQQQVTMYQNRNNTAFIDSIRSIYYNESAIHSNNIDGIVRLEEIIQMIKSKIPSKNASCVNYNNISSPVEVAVFREFESLNHLLQIIESTIDSMSKFINGNEIPAINSIESFQKCMLNNKVPDCWFIPGFRSAQTLTNWIENVQLRYSFISDLIRTKITTSAIWLDGFRYPRSFLIAVRQMYGRKNSVSLVDVMFRYQVLHNGVCVHAKSYMLSHALPISIIHIHCRIHPEATLKMVL